LTDFWPQEIHLRSFGRSRQYRQPHGIPRQYAQNILDRPAVL
jgi:hypothetical protein